MENKWHKIAVNINILVYIYIYIYEREKRVYRRRTRITQMPFLMLSLVAKKVGEDAIKNYNMKLKAGKNLRNFHYYNSIL